MKEKNLQIEHGGWYEKCRIGGITDEKSTIYNGRAGYDLLTAMANEVTEKDLKLLLEISNSRDFTTVCRKRAIRSAVDLFYDPKLNLPEKHKSYKYRDNKDVPEVINLMRRISDDKTNEDEIRVLAYEKYRYLRCSMYGPMNEEEIKKEQELSKTEISNQMKWLRYMRD